MTTTHADHFTPGTQARFLAEDGRWHFGTVRRVRRGGRTVEIQVGKRLELVHPEKLREVGGRP